VVSDRGRDPRSPGDRPLPAPASIGRAGARGSRSRRCAHRLREAELDLAVIYEFRDDEPLPAELRLSPLLEDRLHIALPPGHRLAGERRVALADLSAETWIQGVRHGSTLATLPAACREAGFDPHIAFRTDDPTAWQGLVAAGVGIAVIPQLTFPAPVATSSCASSTR
jgi:DNA-binding transcriptional LysR family regulator